MNDKKRAIFLDRDGVINKEVNYLSDPDDFILLEGTIDALTLLKQKGFLLIVITNQAGIARGLFDEKTLARIHKKMMIILNYEDIVLDEIYYCPHHPDYTGECDCRKPKPGMIFDAKDKFGIDLGKSYFVGDTLNDIETGINANCKTVLVLTGYGREEQKQIDDIKPDFIFNNLYDFAKKIKL